MAEQRRGHIAQALRAFQGSKLRFSTCQGRSISKGAFYSRVASLAQGLQELGLCNGDRVALAGLNSDAYLEWMLAVPSAGGVLSPLNYRWGQLEAAAALELIQPAMLVVDEHCFDWLHTLRCGSIRTRVFIGDEQHRVDDRPEVVPSAAILKNQVQDLELHWAPGGLALICFTSGTTSSPKGVALSHNALIVQSLSKMAIVGYSSEDVYLHTAPLCHIGGISSALAMIMAGGSHLVLPKFDADAALIAVNKHGATAMIVVPTMLQDLVQRASQRRKTVCPSLNTLLNGGGQFPYPLLACVNELFPNARVFSAYGTTEACSSLTFMRVLAPLEHADGVCVGKPAPHVEIRIQEAGCSGHGNVLTRGPHLMEGYLEQGLNINDTAVTRGGWFDTGDIGRIDELGNLWLLGRSKELIKTGGQNVYSSEVEDVLARHPSVLTVAVVGVPDSRLGEMVCSVVTLNKGWEWDDAGGSSNRGAPTMTTSQRILQSHCSSLGLSRFKIPKRIMHSLDPLPATSTGKLKKCVLKRTISLHQASSRL